MRRLSHGILRLPWCCSQVTCVLRMFDDFLAREGLSLDRLHSLIRLSDTGSLIKAADGDASRQARMSHHIKELSSFFSAHLTERSGKSLKLTEEGERLTEIARSFLGALKSFQRGVEGGQLTWSLGATDSIIQWLIVPAIARMSSDKQITLRSMSGVDVVRSIQNQDLDFGVVDGSDVRDQSSSVQICKVRFVMAVPRRMISRKISVRNALTVLPHVAIGGNNTLELGLARFAGSLGGMYRPSLYCDSLGQCIAALKSGKYATVIPEYVLGDTLDSDIEIVDADLEGLGISLSLIWNRRLVELLGPMVEGFRDDLVDQVREISNDKGMELYI